MPEFFLSLSLLVFCCIPIVWIVFHYASKGKSNSGLTEVEARHIDELLQVADAMAERIKTLEAILDSEYADWREHHEQEPDTES